MVSRLKSMRVDSESVKWFYVIGWPGWLKEEEVRLNLFCCSFIQKWSRQIEFLHHISYPIRPSVPKPMQRTRCWKETRSKGGQIRQEAEYSCYMDKMIFLAFLAFGDQLCCWSRKEIWKNWDSCRQRHLDTAKTLWDVMEVTGEDEQRLEREALLFSFLL